MHATPEAPSWRPNLGLMMVPTTGPPSERPCPRAQHMSMALKAGPSKSWMYAGGRYTQSLS
eukprot:4831286-Alexandrium_andersonii.AAC.1